MNEPILDLSKVTGGALQEKVDSAMQRVLDNLQDPNTPWKTKRAVTIKIAISQNEDRDDASVELSVSEKLAPVMPIETRMAIGKDLRTGKSYAQEYGKQIRGQLTMEDIHPQQIVGQDVVDTNTGEVIGNVTEFKVKEA